MNALIHNPSLQKVFYFLPKLATIAFVILLATMLAEIFWQIFTPAKTIPSAPVAREKQSNVKAQAPVDYGRLIANHHLFGKTEIKSTTPKPVKAVAAPVTRLDLKLFGIINGSGQNGYAIISQGQQEQRAYGVGDEPQSGVVIDSISAVKVMLKHNGKLEELRLPEGKNISSIQRGQGSSLPTVLPSAIPGSHVAMPQAGISPTAPSPGASTALPDNDLSALRDAVTNNPDRLLEIASASEAKDKDGNLIGFRLSPGKNRRLFRQLGLRPGDIVTSVNGIQLDSPAKGIAVMGELSGASSIDLTVMRGDQEVSISKSF